MAGGEQGDTAEGAPSKCTIAACRIWGSKPFLPTTLPTTPRGETRPQVQQSWEPSVTRSCSFPKASSSSPRELQEQGGSCWDV